jgi:hypothetical protein
MVSGDDGEELESRPPSLSDLIRLCDELNRVGANYIVIGGDGNDSGRVCEGDGRHRPACRCIGGK